MNAFDFVRLRASTHHIHQILTVERDANFLSQIFNILFEGRFADAVGWLQDHDVFFFDDDIFELNEAQDIDGIVFGLNSGRVSIDSYSLQAFPSEKSRPRWLSFVLVMPLFFPRFCLVSCAH